jgi:hypothetical protein
MYMTSGTLGRVDPMKVSDVPEVLAAFVTRATRLHGAVSQKTVYLRGFIMSCKSNTIAALAILSTSLDTYTDI